MCIQGKILHLQAITYGKMFACVKEQYCVFSRFNLTCVMQSKSCFFSDILSNCRKFIVLLDCNSVSEISEWYFEHFPVYIKRSNCSLSFPFSSSFLHLPF